MEKLKVLFVCIHNSARSQMAEAFLKALGGERFEVNSAGMEPTSVNPLVVEAMGEIGHDLASKSTQSVFDLFKGGRLFDYVITVCDESLGQACPIFPGVVKRLHWSFADPAGLTGGHEQKLATVRVIRDQIKAQIQDWLAGLDG
ncbi:MAG: arsenate reductase ArsC [Desulfarculus sp.]|nr:arsenate reductase ArsC [Desulfarculus sp.]